MELSYILIYNEVQMIDLFLIGCNEIGSGKREL